jgi:hypothetical protein
VVRPAATAFLLLLVGQKISLLTSFREFRDLSLHVNNLWEVSRHSKSSMQ